MSQTSAIAAAAAVYAPAPFDHPKADVILRSSDNVHFRVFKLFLSLASPFFETLFDLPQPSDHHQETQDGLAVVCMAENCKTLDTLLRFCYPSALADDPHLGALEDVISVLDTAKKYSLDVIKKRICYALGDLKIIEAEPLRCFAIARRARLQQETQLAAKHTLSQPLIPKWFKEIDSITATDLLALLSYRKECGDAVYALGKDMSWIKSYYGSGRGCAWLPVKYSGGKVQHNWTVSGLDRHCQCPKSREQAYLLFESGSLQLWEDFIWEVFEALRDNPCKVTVETVTTKTVKNVKALNCPGCSAIIAEGVRGFSELLARKVDEVVSPILLDFDLQRKVPRALLPSGPALFGPRSTSGTEQGQGRMLRT